MANGVTRKILGTGVIGSALTSGYAAISNAVGPIPDGAMNAAERAALIAQHSPMDLTTSSMAGFGIGLGVGAYLRHREVTASRNEHMQDAAEVARR